MQCNRMGDRRRWKTLTKHDNNYVCGKFLALPVQSSAVYSTGWGGGGGGVVWAQVHFCHMRNTNHFYSNLKSCLFFGLKFNTA